MKRLFCILVALALWSTPLLPSDSWNSRVITVTAGTAIRIVNNSVRVDSIVFQMLHGATTGLGYVLNASPQVTCATGGVGTAQVAELAPATSTAPGQSVTVPSNGSATNSEGGLDLQWWCLDGATSGSTVLVSWNPR